MIKNLLFTIFLFIISISYIQATHLNIRLFSDHILIKAEIRIHAGNYHILADGNPISQILKNEIISLSAIGDSVEIKIKDQSAKRYALIEFKGTSFINSFKVDSKLPLIPVQIYDDNLNITAKSGKILLTNNVELEHYIAGVVQSESGSSSDQIEYFFVQAIISRTYALVNYLKHKDEGFNLCDGVHCQVYHGRSKSADITRAVARTNGDVIVDKNKKMISAAFCSNCGGQTVNSEDVWTIPTSYLKSVKDSFCTDQSNSNWTKKIPLAEYHSFLKLNHISTSQPKIANGSFIYKQPERKNLGPSKIPLKDYRNYFALRSTFFDIQMEGENIIFIGRGYGHGVGLCQQGAINMIRLGHDYKEVIRYYYTDVEIIHYSELNYNFMP